MTTPIPPVCSALALTLVAFFGGFASGGELFVDVADQAGVRFVHESGWSKGFRHIIETMCGGAGWLDYDGDGLLDLYIVQAHANVVGAYEPGDERDVLFRNRGDGTFEDVTEKAGVASRRYGFGTAVGDIDNDGDPDLYVTNVGRNTLYLNNGDGTFKDITDASGTGSTQLSSSACFADLDSDGFLDLYVANYLTYDPRLVKPCTGNDLKKPDYCHPNKFKSAPDNVYRGLGDGRFEDLSEKSGVAVAGMFRAKGLGVLPTDIDGDGDVDIVVACDSVPNQIWRNLGDFRFEDAALELGIALNPDGKALAGMGIDSGDVNMDGFFDITITNFSGESNTMFLGDESGFFFEGSAICGTAGPTFLPLAFGCRLFDVELDGDLDIYYACGHTSSLVEVLYPASGEKVKQPDMLFLGDGKGKFDHVSKTSGKWFQRALISRGVATADYDEDGDLDLYVGVLEGKGALLRNENQSKNHWIGLKLTGDGKQINRDAYGALVRVVSAAGVVRKFEVRSAASYLAANDPRVLCGLGAETAIDRIEVRWPNRKTQTFRGLRVDRYHELVFDAGAAGEKN